MMIKKPFTAIVFFIILTCTGYASAIPTGADFLKHGIGARESGMGDSAAGIYSGINAVYWNPAGLSDIMLREFGFMHSEVMQDTSLDFLGYAYPIGDSGVLAASLILFVNEPIPVVDDNQVVLGDLMWMDGAIAFSYARRVRKGLSAGASLKVIHRAESDPVAGLTDGTAVAVDCGLIYESVFEGLNLGVALLNNGSKLRMSGETVIDDLPRTARIGVVYTKEIDMDYSLAISCDLNRILEGNWYPGGGLELSLKKSVFVRMGYYEKEGDVSGPSYGIGFKFGNFQFDYSNAPASRMVGYARNSKISFAVKY